jgi:predicted DNA-binding transcriptional regulator AlpA
VCVETGKLVRDNGSQSYPEDPGCDGDRLVINETTNRDSYVSDGEAARILGLSRSYLRKLRSRGAGPSCAKFGKACRYRVGDLLDWAQAQTAISAARVEHGREVSDRQWRREHPGRRYLVRPWAPGDGPPAMYTQPTITIIDFDLNKRLAGIPEAALLPTADGGWAQTSSDWSNDDAYAGLRWSLEAHALLFGGASDLGGDN